MMEPVVVELIKKRIGDIQRADDVMMVDPDIPYVGGHADGYSEDAVYEIKCPRKVKPVTEEWYWQGVHYVRLLNRLGLTETKTLRVVQLDYDAFDLVVDEYNVSADDMAELEYQLKRASDAISSVVAAKPESRTAAGELLERLVEPNKTFLKRRLHTDEYIEETLEKLKSLRKVRKQLDDEIRRLRETLPPNYYGRNIVFTNRYGVKVLR
ncbi:MAG: hypothetical protein KatS3mg104_2985 [Phycisphaerae bacterium]|nr:MAG: hypothetical protein KatS3mg104_2985 [Phycisphaerae bacterium]